MQSRVVCQQRIFYRVQYASLSHVLRVFLSKASDSVVLLVGTQLGKGVFQESVLLGALFLVFALCFIPHFLLLMSTAEGAKPSHRRHIPLPHAQTQQVEGSIALVTGQ